MNTELMEALEVLEKEKNISKDTLLEAIEQSLIQACKNHFGKADNVKVSINAGKTAVVPGWKEQKESRQNEGIRSTRRKLC